MDNLHAGQYHLKLCWQPAADRRILHKNCCMICTLRCALCSSLRRHRFQLSQPVSHRFTRKCSRPAFAVLDTHTRMFEFLHAWHFWIENILSTVDTGGGQHRSIQPQKVVTKFCPQTIDFQKRILSCFEFLGALSSLYLSIDLPFASWKTHCHFSTLPYGLLP